MTEIEGKNYKAQLELLKGVKDCDNMILHCIKVEAKSTFSEIIEPKMDIKQGQEKVELTVDEFTQLRQTLARLSSDDGFKGLNEWIDKDHLTPKAEKLKILSILM